jgi:hypothetical protein
LQWNGLAAFEILSICIGMAWLPFQKAIAVLKSLKSLGPHLVALYFIPLIYKGMLCVVLSFQSDVVQKDTKT